METLLNEFFDEGTLTRGRDYARRGLVVSLEESRGGALVAQVANGRGTTYRQQINIGNEWLAGRCSCPIGHNCKHVAAVVMAWATRQPESSRLPSQVEGWLRRVKKTAALAAPPSEGRPDDYPDHVKDRLLYVLAPHGLQLKIETFKGRISTAGSGLKTSIRRYDAAHALHSGAAALFIRPVDIELVPALALAGLSDAGYVYRLPAPLRPKGEGAIALIQRLCETGRFLHASMPNAELSWSDDRPAPRLAWRMAADGRQRLEFADAAGRPLHLRSVEGASLWIDAERGLIGALREAVSADVLQLVEASPEVEPREVEALGAALPDALAGLHLPRPRAIRQTRRAAEKRIARLTLGRESAHQGPRHPGSAVQLPTLTLRFSYDGQDVGDGEPDPRIVLDGEIVTLTRDPGWEIACATQLMEAGALPVEDLETYLPGERMLACDFVFAPGETNPHTLETSDPREALDFAFRAVPRLRRDGWEIVETSKWPYRLSDEVAELTVTTEAEAGDAFQGNDWFSLGFKAEIGGKTMDVAPLVAAFLEQVREDWDEVPDVEGLARHLAERPVYLDRGKAGHVALDLSQLAPLLHLFLSHHAEFGALHPSDAEAARLAEEALAGSDIRFADNAGILPLARSLRALALAEGVSPPSRLVGELRDYQAFGAAWMGSLLEAGFGGVLADDMGLGKTVQTLALLQARREAGVPGPTLLSVPTSVLHGWKTQAARFTPDLRLAVLHGKGRATLREAALQCDLVLTTYPLLARDRDWLCAQDWPLVILDEAQTLKNPASVTAKALREIPARGRLALTGTPLENSLQDLWTLIDWVNPGLLGDRKRFQTLFRTPIEKHGDRAAQARLNRRLRPFLLRRTKEEVAAELPPRTEILDRVDLPKPQQALYETVRSAMDARVREAIGTRGLAAARITVLDALLKLRQVCCDPGLVKTKAARSVTDSAKRARLRDLLAELVAEGRRVLVFSQFVEMLRLIEGDLAEAAIPSLTLTGRTQNRAKVLERFADGEAAVFLISLKAGGVGLTLTEADTVILYDPWWNPAVERQAMDRTHRIGQDKPVFVHRLVAAGTVEEKILEMQARKQALADALFEDGSGAADTLLDEAILRDLFAPLAT